MHEKVEVPLDYTITFSVHVFTHDYIISIIIQVYLSFSQKKH